MRLHVHLAVIVPVNRIVHLVADNPVGHGVLIACRKASRVIPNRSLTLRALHIEAVGADAGHRCARHHTGRGTRAVYDYHGQGDTVLRAIRRERIEGVQILIGTHVHNDLLHTEVSDVGKHVRRLLRQEQTLLTLRLLIKRQCGNRASHR